MINTKDLHTSSLNPPKKPFVAPQLSRYGSLTELTQGGGMGKRRDSLGRSRTLSNTLSNIAS